VRGLVLPVSRLALQAYSGEHSGTLYPGVCFQASNGYVERWRRGNAIRSVRPQGAGGIACAASVHINIAQLREKLIGVRTYLVINFDEAALLHQFAPTKLFVLSWDARTVGGVALQRAEARITVIFYFRREQSSYSPSLAQQPCPFASVATRAGPISRTTASGMGG